MNKTIDEKYIQCQMKYMIHYKGTLFNVCVPFFEIAGLLIILIGNKFMSEAQILAGLLLMTYEFYSIAIDGAIVEI